MQIPTQPPEAALIEELRLAMRPKLSVRRAAERAGISEGRWRQIAKGYNQATKDTALPTVAPPDTLARMAKVVGATPGQLRELGRGDAADEMEGRHTGHAASAIRVTSRADGFVTRRRLSFESGLDSRFDALHRQIDTARDTYSSDDYGGAIADLEGADGMLKRLIQAIEDVAMGDLVTETETNDGLEATPESDAPSSPNPNEKNLVDRSKDGAVDDATKGLAGRMGEASEQDREVQ